MASGFRGDGKGSWIMRNGILVAMFLAFSFASDAIAQEWMEYENVGDNFAVNFPGEPTVENITYRLGSGRDVSARVYGVENQAGVFTVTVVDYEGVDVDESANAIAYAAENFRQRGAGGRADGDDRRWIDPPRRDLQFSPCRWHWHP